MGKQFDGEERRSSHMEILEVPAILANDKKLNHRVNEFHYRSSNQLN